MEGKKDILKRLIKHTDGRQKCTLCERSIPKDVERVSFGYSTQYGSSNIRLCGLCILRLAKELDKKPIEEWAKKIVGEEI